MQNARCKMQNSPYGDKYSRLFLFAVLPKTHYFDICFLILALLVGANAKPFLALTEMFTFSAGGIWGSFGVSLVITTSILHHRDERLALFGEQRLSDEVGIDDRRFA